MCDVHARMTYQQVRSRDEAGDLALRQARAYLRFSHEVIYYLRLGDQIKIGYTVDLQQRMRSYPPAAELLAVHPGTLADETAIHERLKPWRAAGREWYHPVREVLDEVAKHVRPDQVTTPASTPPPLRTHRSSNRRRSVTSVS